MAKIEFSLFNIRIRTASSYVWNDRVSRKCVSKNVENKQVILNSDKTQLDKEVSF